jgi:hypothetical protein
MFLIFLISFWCTSDVSLVEISLKSYIFGNFLGVGELRLRLSLLPLPFGSTIFCVIISA